MDVALAGSSGLPTPSTPAIQMRKRWLVFLDRSDPKMSAGSSPPEARLATCWCNQVASWAFSEARDFRRF
jgi:hypothetical protein